MSALKALDKAFNCVLGGGTSLAKLFVFHIPFRSKRRSTELFRVTKLLLALAYYQHNAI